MSCVFCRGTFCKNEDLLADFCHHTGIDADGLQRPGRVNTALSAEEVAIRRALNRILPRQARGGDMHPVYRVALQTLLKFRRKTHTPDPDRRPARKRFSKKNAAQNELLRQEFFPGRPSLF